MAEIDTNISLISKIDKFDDIVYAAAFLSEEDGVISISADRTIRILIKRDGGHFWPTICEYLADSVLCMQYIPQSRRLFVGLANGILQEFVLSEDFNRLSHRRDFLGQIGRIRSLIASLTNNWLFSCGSSPQLMHHCLQSGSLLSTVKLGSWGMCLQIDEIGKFVFVGELAGFVTMLSATQNSLTTVKRIQRHSGCITRLLWDPFLQWLFSGSSDGLICCWDFGGSTGTIHELRHHTNSVNSLLLIGESRNRILLSCGDDGALLAWRMDDQAMRRRQGVSKWVEADNCQICQTPFFWNVKDIYNNVKATWFQKFSSSTITRSVTTEPQRNAPMFGEATDLPPTAAASSSRLPVARQHHCRRCGNAVCGNCSGSTSALPLLGFELPVRICSTCAKQITKEEIIPLCSTRAFSTGHAVVWMDSKPNKKQLLTVGRDRVIKLWNAQNIFATAVNSNR